MTTVINIIILGNPQGNLFDYIASNFQDFTRTDNYNKDDYFIYLKAQMSTINIPPIIVQKEVKPDGTNGILSLEKKKPIYVISQNAETCVVYGMPKVAFEEGGVCEQKPLKEIASRLLELLS